MAKRTAGLTNRQREFARYYVEDRYSNAECARLAGYSHGAAKQYSYKLLDGVSYPYISDLIKTLREERERKYGVTLIGQLKRLDELSKGAEKAGRFSAAINAEKIRSALGGLTIDRREQQHIHELDRLSREEIRSRLNDLRGRHPQVFDNKKIIEDALNKTPAMELIEA